MRTFLGSSIGRKQLVAVTGLGLCGFLVAHLAGNLLLYKGEQAFNSYAQYLEQHPLLLLAEAGLLALFLGHIVMALIVTAQNKMARPQRYEASASLGGRTAGSATMIYTGLFVLIFLIVHLKTFKFGDHGDSLFNLVLTWFKNPLYAGFYAVAMLGLGFHISHGFQSAFQTLGLQFPKYTCAIKAGGWVFAVVITAGFASLPLWGFFLKH